MSEQAHETTETQSAVTVSDHGGVLMRISRAGLWVNPDIPADECAQRVLESLRPLLSHTINTEVNIQVARLAAERDAAQAEVERLSAERDQMATRPRGREVGRFGLDGHYLDAMEPTRPSDEDIWRQAFMVQLMKSSSYQWERSSEEADLVLATYRKRWPR